MAALQVRALYDFDAQPGTGELSIKEGEILSVARQDVGEGWWEGTNSQGQAGLFPASYVEMQETPSAPPPTMPPPPLPSEYAPASSDWPENRISTAWGGDQHNNASSAPVSNADTHRPPVSQQLSYDNDEWDDDWDDDMESTSDYPNGPGNFGLSGPNRSAKPTSSVSDVSNAGL